MNQLVLLPDGDISGSTAHIQARGVHHLLALEVAEVTGKGNSFRLQTGFTRSHEGMLQASLLIEALAEFRPHPSIAGPLSTGVDGTLPKPQ